MADTKTSLEPVTATSFANGDLLRLSQDLGGSTFGNAKIDWTHIAAQIAGLPKGWTTITGTPTTLGGYGITDALMFRTISVAGQSDIVADSTADTLTIVAGTNVTLTTNAATDTLTIAASGGSATPAGSDTQVQFNNAGAFGASATFKFKLTPTPTLIFGDVLTGVDLIVASDTGVSGHVDGRNLIINGGDGFDNGASGNAAGGNLEFSGGDSHGASDAGDAEIGGGNAADSGAGGPAFVFGGNSNSGTGGDVHLNPGNSTSGTKGKISGKIPGGADVTLFDASMSLDVARIAAAAITNAKLANMAASTIKGSVAGGTPADLTATQATGILSPFVASGASHAKGLVPDPGATARAAKFLREDATFQVPWGVPKIYQTGNWYGSIGGSGTATAFAGGTIWYLPVLLFGDGEAVKIGLRVTSGSSANSATAIYSAFDTRPNTLLQQSPNTAIATNVQQTWTLNAAALLHDMPGAYLAYWSDTAITMQIWGGSNVFSILGSTNTNFGDLTSNGNFTGWSQSIAYTGTFPSTPGTLTKQTSSMPQLFWQQQ